MDNAFEEIGEISKFIFILIILPPLVILSIIVTTLVPVFGAYILSDTFSPKGLKLKIFAFISAIQIVTYAITLYKYGVFNS